MSKRKTACLTWCLAMWMGWSGTGPASARPKQEEFLNRFVVPILDSPPTLDGVFNETEWRGCAGFDGLTQVTGGRAGQLDERSGRTYIGATEDSFYIALATELPEGAGQLVTAVDKDIFNVIYDDSFEVWLNSEPGEPRRTEYQALFNSLSHGVYTTHTSGGAPEIEDWHGGFEFGQGFTDSRWVTEIRVPIASIAPGRKSTEGEWSISVCRSWKQPWAQTSSPGGNFRGRDVRFRFVDQPSPVVWLEQVKDPFTRDIECRLRVHNPADTAQTVKARFELTRNTMPAVIESTELKMAAGAEEEAVFTHKEDNSDAFDLDVAVTSLDGAMSYYARKVAWGTPRQKRWDTTVVEKRPVDFRIGYYPYRNKLRVLVDVSGLPEEADVDTLRVQVNRQWSQEVLAAATIDAVDEEGRAEVSMVLPPLADDIYEVAVQATGHGVPPRPLIKNFVRKNYPWEHNPMGRSNTVYPPFTPIELEGSTLRTVLRSHQLNDLGLLGQVTAGGEELLAAPMRFVAKVDGVERELTAQPLRLASAEGHEVVTESEFGAAALKAGARVTWGYDGTAKYDLTLHSTAGGTLDALVLEIPFAAAATPMIHAMTDGMRKGPISAHLPKGKGVVWTPRELILGEMPGHFCTYIYLGNPLRGLCWFADNDLNWSWDRRTPNVEVLRRGEEVVLRVNLVNEPVVIEEPRTITFGLLAAPVKPRPEGWRHRDRNVRLMATSINWLAGPGICGNVYPVGRDPRHWRALALADLGQLPEKEAKELLARGIQYFESTDTVERWVAHAKHHLVDGGRRPSGKKTVYYYNRATNAFDEEYATFLDEWLLKELPGHDFKKVTGEQKLVPSESYIDFALHWYAKSFEYGRNTGVYWDNWFIKPSYNLEMTDAYRDATGEIVPAAGIWAFRELAKRTFVMMNEHGMEPVIFPHMTSTSILPMLAFASWQYDWEWRYSGGDAQYRFDRDYLLLASTGELAGVVPIALHDRGPQATNEWVQRTFAGVCLVHEIESGGQGKVWHTLRDPWTTFLGIPGARVWRYWDEGPLPVTTGHPDLPFIVAAAPGEGARVVLCSYLDEDGEALLEIDPQQLGIAPPFTVADSETGQAYPVDHGRVRLPCRRHEVIGLTIK